MDISCNDIKNFIEKETKVNMSRKDRKTIYVNIRNIYYLLCYKYAKISTYEIIGKEVSRNHATVIHGLENIQWQLSSNLSMNKDLINLFNDLEKKLLLENQVTPEPTLEDRVIQLEEQLKKIQHDLSA